jgi:hypothetical protein
MMLTFPVGAFFSFCAVASLARALLGFALGAVLAAFCVTGAVMIGPNGR